MTAGRVRAYYNVPAKKGGRVLFEGRPGVIVGFRDQYLRVRLDGETGVGTYHPLWHIDYLTDTSDDGETT